MANEPQTVTQALDTLRALQSAHSELRELQQLLDAKPRELEVARDRLSRQKQAADGLEEGAKKIQMEIDRFELELQTGEEKIANLRTQQNGAKTNREYKAFQDEIDNIRAENSRIEDQILELMTKIESSGEQEAKAQKNVEEEERRMAESERGLAAEIDQIRAEHDETKARYDGLAGQVDPKYMEPYARLARHRDGIAVAPVKNGMCGSCFINLPPQTINALMGARELVFCHSCGRILFLESSG